MRSLIFLLCLAATCLLPAEVAEFCGNQVDDDGDVLIECEDDDCTFPLLSNSALGNTNSHNVALGDIHCDGDLDMVVGICNNQPNRVYTSDGNGALAIRRLFQ
jgi:hypothetical protein